MRLFGDPVDRLPHIVCLGVDGVEAEPVLLGLDQAGIAVHSGSSCSSETLEPSPVLEAMGVDGERSLRLSVGWSTTDADVDAFVAAFPGGGAGCAHSGADRTGSARRRRRSAPGRFCAVRAVVCRELGPLETLVLEEQDPPEPGEGQVVVDVRAAGVNFVDGLICQGRYQIKPPSPSCPAARSPARSSPSAPGSPGSTAVTGSSPSPGSVGSPTRWRCRPSRLVPMPGTVDFDQAATLIQSYCTVLFTLTRRTTLAPGEWVLVLGAGGGVGLAATDVATALGGRVIAAASTLDKLGGGAGHGGRGDHRLRGRGPQGAGP